MRRRGRVSLVGAGPGDPGLITLKGLQCIRQADVIVYDRLVNPALLDHAKEGCQLTYVGKGPDRHTLSQEEINRLLVDRASDGEYVVRLKGGDPFVFGRGGEEAEALAKEGIPFDVVPGVSSAVAAPAYAGIPVTHRGLASSVAIVTGHEDPTKDEGSVEWERLAKGPDALVILMGMGNLKAIVDRLVKGGRPAETPIALVRWGTTARQETLEGTLATIVEQVGARGFEPPVVAIIGETVRLRETLNWYESRPLFGKRVLVTRSRQQASALSSLLTEEGADVIELPAIEIRQTEENLQALDQAIANLEGYQWAVFTSVNGVDAFYEGLKDRGQEAKGFNGVKVCAIGPATARALEARGVRVDMVPKSYVAESIIGEFKGHDIRGVRFLLPRAQEARPVLAQGLRGLGAIVDEAPTYRSLPPTRVAGKAIERLMAGEVDIATFASSSTVKNLVQMLDGNLESLGRAIVACIGPVTAATAREVGLRVDVVASEHTIPGLVEAIVQHVRSRQ